MVGRLKFPFRRRTATATLDDDGRWRCDDVPSLVRVLDTFYSPRRDGIPGEGHPGDRHLRAAAAWLKGTVEFGPGPGRN